MRVLALAYTGSGGDFHPVVALCIGLRGRGHDVALFCDPEGARQVSSTELTTVVDEPRWAEINAVQREFRARIRQTAASARTRLTIELQGRRAALLIPAFAAQLRARRPDVVVTSTLTAAAREAALGAGVPWCVVNSTYDTRRDQDDPLLRAFAAGMRDAPLIVHATDAVFDEAVPARGEHYVGPLLWEPREAAVPSYLREPGAPWALVTVSLIPQGDVAIVPIALEALSQLRLRSVATIGVDNDATGLGTLRAEPTSSRRFRTRRCSSARASWSGMPDMDP